MVKVAPSILAADFEHLEEEVESVVAMGADMIHVDVMDGEFVNNETPGLMMLERARKATEIEIDSHLMVENPERWLDDFLLSDRISFHIEAVTEETAEAMIEKLHQHEIKVGIAIKPATSVETIQPFLEKIDFVLVMTVEPGWAGQKMIPECLEKVREIRKCNPDIEIEVDGGVNLDTIAAVREAGANSVVAGAAIFHVKNREEVIQHLKSE